MNGPAPRRNWQSGLKLTFWLLVVPAVLIALYFVAVLNWNYSTGERAGWVQKFSKKGWICKTWEGELSMVSMPGASPEKFYFTVWDEKIAADINAAMGRRVSLHYDEKVGLPTTCFGETRHWVNGITVVQEIPLAPGITIPAPGVRPPAVAPDAAAPADQGRAQAPAPRIPAEQLPAPAVPAPQVPAAQNPASQTPPPNAVPAPATR
jgi:hypothetical protein